MERSKTPLTLVHLSDELFLDKKDLYSISELILRPYFYLNRRKDCFFIPVGFQNGFLNKSNKIKDLEKRQYTWSFFGQEYGDRKVMINELSNHKNHYIHSVDSFMSEEAASPNEMIKIYEDTIFTPCPYGIVNPDTFRILEVLEQGCIPIVKKFVFVDYYKYIYGEHPFIVVNNWNEASEIITKYLSDPIILNKKFDEVHEWYINYKNNLKEDIQILIEKRQNNLISEQFKLQNKARRDPYFILSYFYWFKFKRSKVGYSFLKNIYKFKQNIKKKIDNE
tara:strand:- start:5158 stop:5994 length:837 start_codon:yes stop_codon:yes gene_type:complete